MSTKVEFLTVSKAKVTNIEFTFDGEDPEHVAKRAKKKRGPLSIHPDLEDSVLQSAMEAFLKRYPIEVYQDRFGRIVKIQPSPG
jgi:hypothetical protein